MNHPVWTEAKKEVEMEFDSSSSGSHVVGQFKHMIAQQYYDDSQSSMSSYD